MGDSKGVCRTDVGVSCPAARAVGESGQRPGVSLYGLDSGMSICVELKASESGRGVLAGFRRLEATVLQGCMYCFRAGRGVGVKIGAFLNGDGDGEVFRSITSGRGWYIGRGCLISKTLLDS